MPRLFGERWVAGVGKGVVSVGAASGSGAIIATDAGDAHWWHGRPLYQREAAGRGAFLESDGGEQVSSLGANRLRAGGPVWAAWLAGVGYRDSLGRTDRDWNVADVGPDGTVAVMVDRSTGVGLRLLNPDGTAVEVEAAAPDDQTVHVLGAGRAIWTEQGHTSIGSVGLQPGLALVTKQGFWLRAVQLADAIWLLYQDERDRLLWHRAGDPMGFVVAQGNTFRPDVNTDRIVWATHEGERPEDVVVRMFRDLPARVDLRDGAPVDPPIEPPIIVPPKEPVMHVPNRAAQLAQFHQEFNGGQPINELADKHRFTAAFVPWMNAHEPDADAKGRYARKSRESSPDIVSKDTIAFWLGPKPVPTENTNGVVDAVDIIGSDGGVSWDTRAEKDDPAYHEIRALWMPIAGAVEPPVVVPPVDDDLAAQVKALTEQFSAFGGRLAAVERVGDASVAQLKVSAQREADFETRIKALEKPGTGGATGGTPVPADLAKQIAAELFKLFSKLGQAA